MSAPSAFTRELFRVTCPIAALGVFALLFGPAPADEQYAGAQWEVAPVRCGEPPELIALDAHSAPSALETAYAEASQCCSPWASQ
jgi:hypothetical protein